jgi:hypothetical protein
MWKSYSDIVLPGIWELQKRKHRLFLVLRNLILKAARIKHKAVNRHRRNHEALIFVQVAVDDIGRGRFVQAGQRNVGGIRAVFGPIANGVRQDGSDGAMKLGQVRIGRYARPKHFGVPLGWEHPDSLDRDGKRPNLRRSEGCPHPLEIVGSQFSEEVQGQMEFIAVQDSHPWKDGRLNGYEAISGLVRERNGDEIAWHGVIHLKLIFKPN